MRFGICASFQDVAALPVLPFDYLEESVQRFLMPERPQEEFEHVLQSAHALSIPIETANVFLPPDLLLVATPARRIDSKRITAYVQTALRRAEQAGIRVIVFGSGSARACPADYNREDAQQQIIDHLALWSTWAGDYGVQIALEPLRYAEASTFNTVAETGKHIAQIAPSGAKLLADTYHMASNGEDPTTLVPVVPLLAHVHVAERGERSAPGYSNDDFRPYFSALHQGGYNTRISIECRWHSLQAEVERAIRVLREQWQESA